MISSQCWPTRIISTIGASQIRPYFLHTLLCNWLYLSSTNLGFCCSPRVKFILLSLLRWGSSDARRSMHESTLDRRTSLVWWMGCWRLGAHLALRCISGPLGLSAWDGPSQSPGSITYRVGRSPCARRIAKEDCSPNFRLRALAHSLVLRRTKTMSRGWSRWRAFGAESFDFG